MRRPTSIGILLVLLIWFSAIETWGQPTIDGDGQINKCETKNYTISIQNTSGSDISGVVVTASLANLTGFAYTSPSQISTNGNPLSCPSSEPIPQSTSLVWNLDDLCGSPFNLAAGETLEVSFSLTADCSSVSGSLNAEVDYVLNGSPANVEALPHNIMVLPGAVTIKKTPNVIPQEVGQNITWTLIVENSGIGVIENVEVTDVLGDGLAYVSATQNGSNSGQTTTWTSNEYVALASMDPGDILTMDITAQVIACENLDNTADVRFGCAPSPAGTCFNTADDGGTATASVQRIVNSPLILFTPPDINFTYCGDTETVSFTITNIGDGAAYNVFTIIDFPGFTVSNVSAGANYNVAQTRFELIDPLAATGDPGDSYNLSFDLTYTGWCGDGFPAGDLLWQKLYQDACNQEFYPPVELSTINAPSNTSALTVSKTGGPTDVEIGGSVTYNITSSYSGPLSCGSGSVGPVTVVDTIPTGLTITDFGGGTWNAGARTITWIYTPPASLNTAITVQIPDATQCETYCNTLFTNTITATSSDCCGCALSASDSQTTAIECTEGLTSEKISSAPTERCDETTYTNTYIFDGGSGVVLSDLVFTEEANLEQQYNGNLSITLTGTGNITGSAAVTDTTPGPGGTLLLDFSGAAATPLAGQTLTIIYDLTATEDTIAACGGTNFYSWSSLNIGPTGSQCLADGIIHETTVVNVGSPAMALTIDGLGQIFNTCETETITQTLTQTSNFNPKDIRLVLSGLNYYVVDPAASICGGVAPVSCTPTIDGSGNYVWIFEDAFTGSGQSATLQLDVQKRCSGTGDLTATAYFDDLCNDDATADDLCSTVATETPALLLRGDLLIEKTPETYYADTNTVQWEIYVTNRGTGAAYNVWVDDILGAGLLYDHGVNPVVVDNMTGVTVNDSLDHSGGTINGASVEITQIAAGERRQITFIARLVACTNLTNDVTANWGCSGVDCQTDITDNSVVEIPAANLINTTTITPAGGVDACASPRGLITLRNAGQATAYNLVVTETLPANLLYVSGSTRWRLNGGSWNGPNVVYDPNPTGSPLVWTRNEIPGLSSAAPGDTIDIEFDMSADCPFTGGDITVSTAYENPCADGFFAAPNTFSVAFNAPDIAIDKTRVNDPIGCNEAIQWTITVTNDSAYTLPVIWVEDTMDDTFAYASSVGDPPYTSDNGTNTGQLVTWELRNVNPGDTVTLTLNATTDGPSPTCSADLDNTVIAYWGCGAADGSSATQPGADAPDDALCLTSTGIQAVRTETRQPDLTYLSFVVSPASIDACNDSTQITVVAENPGPTDANSIDLAITLPPGITYNAGTAEAGLGSDQSSATAAIGTIGDPAITGSTITFYDFGDTGNNLVTTVQADGGNDTLVLRFTVQSACYVTDNLDFDLRFYDCCGDTQHTATESITLTAEFAQLAITKTPATAQIDCATGSQEWVFTVTNNGTGNAQVVRVEDTPGDWLTMQMGTFIDVDGTGATIADLGGGVYGWEFNNLGAGNSVTFRVSTQLNPDYGLPAQANCNRVYRQNNAEAVWGCGVSGQATDLNATTTAYDCTDSTPASTSATTLQMPNLVVTSITPQVNCTADGSVSGSISVRVTNTGDGATSGDFTVQVTDGKGWTGTGTHSGAIAAGGFADVIINTATWAPACNCTVPYTFNATVDLNGDICECNEDDNTTTTTYAPPIPDLSITDIDFSNVSCSTDGISGNVRVQVQNNGCGAATNFQVVLSTDGCLIFTPQTVSSLAANASTWLDFNVSGTWSNCADGSCDFTASVDQPNTVCECDGTNNSRTETFSSPLPDLTVTDIDFTNITCTNDGYAGSVDVTVHNQGPGVALNVPVGLGTDGCLTFAGTQSIASLASGASSTVTFAISSAWSDCTDDSCDFTAIVDPLDTICECDGSNNTRSETHTNTLPDLAVNSVTPLAACSTDGSVSGSVTVNVGNTGFSDVTGAVVQLVSTCGIVFVSQTVDLAAGTSTDLTFNHTPTTANCNCTYTATIDPANAVCECTNSNNTVVSSPYVTQIPDLIVSSDTLTATCSIDGQVNVGGTLTVNNNGCGADLTSDIPVRLTLYDNTGCGGNVAGTWDTTLTAVNIASGGGSQVFTLPDQTLITNLVANSTGCQFSIGVDLDYTNAICEFDGANNTYCADNKSVDIPDLRGQSDTLAATCSTDGAVSVAGTLTVANDGCGSNLTADIPVRLTLYDNTGGSGTQLDQWTETLSVVNIAGGGGTQTFSLIPRTVVTDLVSNSTGCQFSIGVEYDYSDTICESDAANNTYVADNKAVSIPDLGVSTDTLTVTCLDGGQARVSGTVTLVNDGCGSNLNDDVPLRLTLFGDAGCSGAQVDQWTETVTGLNIPAGGGLQTFSLVNRDITTDLCEVSTNNAMSVRVEADEPNTICESDGTDNLRCADKTVAVPDLTVTSVATAVTCQTDGSVSGTNVSVANTGCGDAVGSVVRLTSDCGLTFVDQTIDLAQGATAEVFFPFTSGFTDCNCNFSAEIDPDGAICETDDTNNSAGSTDTLSVPDIEVQDQDMHLACMGDGYYQIDGTVTLVNNGCGTNLTDNVRMRFTIAAGAECGGTALTRWTQTLTGVDLASSGGTQTFRVQTYGFNGDLCGSSNCVYSIQAEADYDNQICEWDGTDNSLCSADIPLEIPDLTITDIEPNAVCSDASALVTVKNNGCSASPDGTTIRISGDTSGTVSLDSIPPGGTAKVTVALGELECGAYNISAAVDPENALCECDGTNNDMTASFTVGCPTVAIEDPGEVCHDSGATLIARIAGGRAPVSFNWVGNGTFDPISGSSPGVVQTSWTPPSGATGPVPISVAVVDAGGCTTRGEVTVDVKDCSGATGARPAGECCLKMEIEHVVSSRTPDIIPVEGPLWVDTFNSMLAAAAFAGMDENLSDWLRKEGIDPDRESLISRRYLRTADKAGLFARFNVGSITMQSGMGLDMTLAPDVRSAAVGKGISVEEEVKATLQALAAEAGVKQIPAMRPLVLEYAGGVPIYHGDPGKGDLSWDRTQMDRSLVPLVWGTTLAAQAQLLPKYITSSDPMEQFTGRVMAWQMVQKVKLIQDRLVQTSKTGDLYVAHAYQMKSSSEGVTFSVKTDEIRLSDQAALLWGLSRMRDSFGRTGLYQPKELEGLIKTVWNTLERMVDAKEGTYADEGRVVPYDAMLISLALASMAEEHSDLSMAGQAKKRLGKHTAFMAQKLMTPDGGVLPGYDLKKDRGLTGAKTLADQATVLRALLVHPTGLSPAGRIYTFMEEKLWDKEHQLYRDRSDWPMTGTYTPQSVGATVSGIAHLAMQTEADKRMGMLDHIRLFFETVVAKSELQQRSRRGLPFEGSSSLITGRGEITDLRRPIPVPSRRYRDDIIETGLGRQPAQVLVSQVDLRFIPLEAEKLQALTDSIDTRVERFGPRQPLFFEPIRLPKLGPPEKFETAGGMLAASALMSAAPVLFEQGRMTDDAFFADPSMASHMATAMAETARGSMVRLTMTSGNGVPLQFSAPVIQMAKTAGIAPEQALSNWFQKAAQENGLTQAPQALTPIFVEFAGGWPDYPQGLSQGWDVRGADRKVSLAGLSQALMLQLAYMQETTQGQGRGEASLDGFIRQVTGLAVAAKFGFIEEAVKVAGEAGLSELPATFTLVRDSAGKVLDLTFPEPGGSAFGRISLLGALGALVSLDDTAALLIPDYGAVRDKAMDLSLKVWDTIRSRYLDASGKITGLSLADAGLAAEVMGRIVQALPGDYADKPNMAALVASLGDYLVAGKMTGQSDEEPEGPASRESLADKAAEILGLIRAGEILNQPELAQAALDRFKVFDQQRWAKRYQIYLPAEQHEHQDQVRTIRYRYSAEDIGLTIGMLSRIMPLVDSNRKTVVAERLSAFAANMVAGIHRNATGGMDSWQDPDHIRPVALFLTDREQIFPGDILTFKVTAKNQTGDDRGCGDLEDFKVRNVLPPGVAYIPDSARMDGRRITTHINGRSLTWNVGDLAMGESVLITFRARVDRNKGDRVHRDRSESGGYCFHPVDGGDTALCGISEDEKIPLGAVSRIKGVIYLDGDANGRRGPRDNGLSGIRLILDENRAVDTDHTGAFEFDKVLPGVYQVRLDLGSLPVDLHPTTETIQTVVIGAGKTYLLEFGLSRFKRIEGVVFDDQNGNGVQDGEDPAVAAVKVRIKGTDHTAYTADDGSFRMDRVFKFAVAAPVIDEQQPLMKKEGHRLRISIK